MATKRPSPLEEPPAADSSSSEENEEEEEEEESSEEEEEESPQPTQQHKKASSPPPPTPVVDKIPDSQPRSSTSDDDGTESDSDTDLPPRSSGIALDVKPVSSRPMGDASKLKQPRSKLNLSASTSTSTTAKSAVKRPIENNGEEKDLKRAKKKVAEVDGGFEKKKSGDESKKPLFQRLWSEDDEIVILKGIIEYTSKNGVDPLVDANGFHDFIKKSLHIDFEKRQLMAKIRKLKTKFMNNVGKGKKGEDRTFSKAHEEKSYQLSKKIWGSEAKNGGVDQTPDKVPGPSQRELDELSKLSTKGKLNFTDDGDERSRHPKNAVSTKKDTVRKSGPSQSVNGSTQFNKSTIDGGFDDKFMEEGLKLIGSAKRAELEKKWAKLKLAETEIFLRRIELVQEQTKLVLDAYKASGH